jgi:hypothetical protein
MIRRIFINYRHDDSPGTAGRIFDHLQDALGPDSLFIDDEIPKGEDFEKYLNAQLNGSFVFLAIIGPNWLHVRDKHGHRRLDTDDDWVRVEIRTALSRQIKVIPVIIDDAVVPDASDLPSDLRPLANRQAITLRNRQFDQDFAALVETLREGLGANQLNGGGANGSTANNVLVFQAKKFQEGVQRYLTTGKRLGLGRLIVGVLILLAVALFIYLLQAPIGGGSGLNSAKEEASPTQDERERVRAAKEKEWERGAEEARAANEAAKERLRAAEEATKAIEPRAVPSSGISRSRPAIPAIEGTARVPAIKPIRPVPLPVR